MKITNKALIAVGILSLASCSTLRSRPEGVRETRRVQILDSLAVSKFTFENGLRLIVLEDDSAPTFAYQTWFDVGSRDEQPGKTGLAHLFEHMMFKGTTRVPDGEFDRLLDEAGAEGQNAYTTHDHTTYIEELPSERLEMIVRLEADRMRNLVINDQSFETERAVVQNERRFRNENSPDGLMYQELYGLAYKTHSYRWPVIGYEQDLASMSADDAREFYNLHYAPNRAVIVVSGDVQTARVLELVSKHYGQIPAVEPHSRQPQSEPEQHAPRRKTLRLNMQVEKLLVSFPIPALNHPDMAALDLLQMVLSGGRSSRLQKALVETGIASRAYAYAADARDPSLFLFGVSLQSGKKAHLAEKILLQELERLSTEEVSDLELERAKNLLSFEFYGGLEGNSERARFLGHYELQAGGVDRGLEMHRARLTVTPARIRDAAATYFQPRRRSAVFGLRK